MIVNSLELDDEVLDHIDRSVKNGCRSFEINCPKVTQEAFDKLLVIFENIHISKFSWILECYDSKESHIAYMDGMTKLVHLCIIDILAYNNDDDGSFLIDISNAINRNKIQVLQPLFHIYGKEYDILKHNRSITKLRTYLGHQALGHNLDIIEIADRNHKRITDINHKCTIILSSKYYYKDILRLLVKYIKFYDLVPIYNTPITANPNNIPLVIKIE